LDKIKEPIYPSLQSRAMARGLLQEQSLTWGNVVLMYMQVYNKMVSTKVSALCNIDFSSIVL